MRYMAPELFLDIPEFSTKSDVYAYGMTLFYLFKNDHPYSGKSLDEINKQSNLEDNQVVRDIPSDIPKTLEELIRSCIKPQADRRPEISELLLKKMFSRIIDEFRTNNHGPIGKVWLNEEEGISGERNELSWPDFKNAWRTFDTLNNLTSLNDLCLRGFMNISLDPLGFSGPGGTVNIEPRISRAVFENFAKAFNHREPNLMYDTLYYLVKAQWYFGLMEFSRVSKIIKDFVKGKSTEAFLVIQKRHDEQNEEVKGKGPFIILHCKDKHLTSEGFLFDWSKPLDAQLLSKLRASQLPPSPPREQPVFKRLQQEIEQRDNKSQQKTFLALLTQNFGKILERSSPNQPFGYAPRPLRVLSDDMIL